LSEEWGPILGLNDKGMELLAIFIAEAFTPLFLKVIE